MPATAKSATGAKPVTPEIPETVVEGKRRVFSSILSCFIGLGRRNQTESLGAFESKRFSSVWREGGFVHIAKLKLS